MTTPDSNDDQPIFSDLLRKDQSFERLVGDFVDGLSERLTRMEALLRAADFDGLQMIAHQLKGTGGGYGYPILTERGARLEMLAKAEALQDCMDAIGELKSIASRVTSGLDAQRRDNPDENST